MGDDCERQLPKQGEVWESQSSNKCVVVAICYHGVNDSDDYVALATPFCYSKNDFSSVRLVKMEQFMGTKRLNTGSYVLSYVKILDKFEDWK